MNDRNLLKGFFLIAIALGFGLGALGYPIGRVARAGAGFFPLMVSSILLLLGVAMVVRSRFTERVPMYYNLRNIVIIMVSLAGFALLSRYLNMIVGITFLVFCSTYAGTTYSVRRNVAIVAVLVLIGFAFQKGLGLQLPLY